MKTIWWIIGAVVVVIGLGITLWSVGSLRAFDSAIDEVDAAYQIKSLPEDYPRRLNSTEAAWRLDDAAGRLGLHVVPVSERARERPGSSEWHEVKGEVSGYISALRSSEAETPPAIPDEVMKFLERHETDLVEIEKLLLGDEEIRFASRLEDGPSAPLPNLLGQVSLTRLLVTRSMEAELRGDSEAAWRSLEAVWRLERTLSDQPALICRLISIADIKMLVTGARRLEHPVPDWFSEVESIEHEKKVVEGIRAEMHLWASMRDQFSIDVWSYRSANESVDLIREPIMRRLLYWEAAYSMRDMLRLIEAERQSDPCAGSPVVGSVEPLERPWWSGPPIATPNLASAFTRSDQVALDVEGTVAVLDLKEERDAFEERPSSVCSGESWKVERLEDGSTRVYFTGRIIPPENQPEGSEVVTEHVLPPR